MEINYAPDGTEIETVMPNGERTVLDEYITTALYENGEEKSGKLTVAGTRFNWHVDGYLLSTVLKDGTKILPGKYMD